MQRLIPHNLKRKHLDSHRRLFPPPTGTRLGRHGAAFWRCVADSGQVSSSGSLHTPEGQCCLVAETQILLISPNTRLSLSTFYAFLTQIKHFKEWQFSGWLNLENGPRGSLPSETEGGEGEKEVKQERKDFRHSKLSVLWGSSWDDAILDWARVWGMKDLPSRKDEMECATAVFAKWGL